MVPGSIPGDRILQRLEVLERRALVTSHEPIAKLATLVETMYSTTKPLKYEKITSWLSQPTSEKCNRKTHFFQIGTNLLDALLQKATGAETREAPTQFRSLFKPFKFLHSLNQHSALILSGAAHFQWEFHLVGHGKLLWGNVLQRFCANTMVDCTCADPKMIFLFKACCFLWLETSHCRPVQSFRFPASILETCSLACVLWFATANDGMLEAPSCHNLLWGSRTLNEQTTKPLPTKRSLSNEKKFGNTNDTPCKTRPP